MRILVLGSNGQLGRDCVELFAGRHEVIGADLPEVDVTDSASLAAVIEKARPAAVVNCAAYTAVDRAESERELCFAVNSLAPGIIARACAECGIRMLHISTDYVFDGEREPPMAYVETDKPNPRSVYGLSKYEGEQAVIASCAGAAILRTAWLYGAQGPNFLKTMLRLSLEDSGRVLRVVDDQWGSPTSAEQLARQMLRVLEAPAEPVGVFHATAAGYTTWYELAKTFLEAMGVPHRLEPCVTAEYPTPARRPRCAILENRALKALGLDVMGDWREEVLAFARRHGAVLMRG